MLLGEDQDLVIEETPVSGIFTDRAYRGQGSRGGRKVGCLGVIIVTECYVGWKCEESLPVGLVSRIR